MPTPSKFAGEEAELKKTLEKYLDRKNLVKYDENKDPKAAKVQEENLKKAKFLIQDLHKLEPAMSFGTAMFVNSLSEFADALGKKGLLKSATDQTDWAETMKRRLVNLCRVVSQALCSAKRKNSAGA